MFSYYKSVDIHTSVHIITFVEILEEPSLFPECKTCRALDESKRALRRYSGLELSPQARINCFVLASYAMTKTDLDIANDTLVVMNRLVFEKDQENDPIRFKPNWRTVVACPGKIRRYPLTR